MEGEYPAGVLQLLRDEQVEECTLGLRKSFEVPWAAAADLDLQPRGKFLKPMAGEVGRGDLREQPRVKRRGRVHGSCRALSRSMTARSMPSRAGSGGALLPMGIAASPLALGRARVLSVGRASKQRGDQGRAVHALRQLVVHVAERDLQIGVDSREFAAPQALVDRQQVEVGFHERIGDLEGALGRMQADELQPARQLRARLAPHARVEGRGHGIAVEDGEDEIAQGIELAVRSSPASGRSTPSTSSPTMASPIG